MYKFTSLGGSKSQDTQESCRNSDKLSNTVSPSIKKKKKWNQAAIEIFSRRIHKAQLLFSLNVRESKR